MESVNSACVSCISEQQSSAPVDIAYRACAKFFVAGRQKRMQMIIKIRDFGRQSSLEPNLSNFINIKYVQ
jgi:hypothetical protein